MNRRKAFTPRTLVEFLALCPVEPNARADLTTDRPEFVVISTPAPHPLRLNPAKESFTAIHHQKWSFPCQDASVSTTLVPEYFG